MGSKMLLNAHRRKKISNSELRTQTIINEIFDLADSNIKNSNKINDYMHELKSRGKDAIYEYYDKYIRRVMNGEVELENINAYYALNEVLKMNDAEKIWKFVNLLQDLAYETDNKFRLNYNKCAKAMAKTGNVKYNLIWAEVYPECNEENIDVVIKSNQPLEIASLVRLVPNLTNEQIAEITSIVNASKNAKAKKELKISLKDKNTNLINN